MRKYLLSAGNTFRINHLSGSNMIGVTLCLILFLIYSYFDFSAQFLIKEKIVFFSCYILFSFFFIGILFNSKYKILFLLISPLFCSAIAYWLMSFLSLLGFLDRKLNFNQFYDFKTYIIGPIFAYFATKSWLLSCIYASYFSVLVLVKKNEVG